MSVVAALPGAWFTVVLAFCFMTVWAAYGIRALFSWQAFGALILFFVGVAASNAWQFIPQPGPDLAQTDLQESWRLWVVHAKEANHIADKWMGALAIGFAFVMAFRLPNRAPMLTYLIVFVWFVGQIGEGLEYIVCKLNDPALGFEHTYYASGGRKPACGRAMGNLGPLVFPALTALPLPVILWHTWRKSRLRAF